MKLFLIAGEASGDALGGALMAGLHELAPGVQCEGIGGPRMEAQGLRSLFPVEEIAVMGLAEILPRYAALKRRIAETADAVAKAQPDALVTIDIPEFSLRVARLVRQRAPAIRIIHYVAPSVWAWRPGRAARMAAHVDHVLALLPFEPPYMTAAGMTCDFVGHPVVAEPRATPAEAAAFRERLGLAPGQPVILCLPGSRRSEVGRLMPVFRDTLMILRDREPTLRIVIPTTRGVAEMVRTAAAGWPVTPVVIEAPEEKRAAFAAARLALAASGTVSLELAANRVPMVIAYDMNPLTRLVMRQLVRVDTVTLVNLVSETRAIPEFLGRDCRPDRMARVLATLLDDGPARAEQLQAMEVTMARLGEGGEPPGLRAARAVLAAAAR